MKKLLFVCVVLVACFYFGRFSTSVLPIQNVELTVSPTKTSSSATQTAEPYALYQKTDAVVVAAAEAKRPEMSERLSALVRTGRSHKLFRAIYDQKLFQQTPITSKHLDDLRTRLTETKQTGFVMHKSYREIQDRDLIALLQGFSMNKQVYLDQKIRDDYMQILKDVATQKVETLSVRRQAVRSLTHLASFMKESERKRLWKDIPSNVISLGTHSDTELVGALLEK